MLYLLDANVLIDANRDYYPIARIPEFWDWLVHVGQQGKVKIPLEVYEEIKDGKDALAKWTKEHEVREALLLREEANVAQVSQVTSDGYAPDLTDDEVEKIGRDPFLVSYAFANLGERCLVTTEVSKPSRQRGNRHMPDVCDDLGIRWCDTFKFIRELDFSTRWKSD